MDSNVWLNGVRIVCAGNIPTGAGVSSSASFECGLAKALDTYFGLGWSDWDIVNIGHNSENNFLGVQSGILDQFASTFGKEEKAMIMDCSDRTFRYVSAAIPAYSWLLINSMTNHSHTDSGYNDKPAACRKIVTTLQSVGLELPHLSALTLDQLYTNKHFLTKEEASIAAFILNENRRVRFMETALSKGDALMAGALLYESHAGLQYDYKVSCVETDTLVDLVRLEPAVAGARMMGGGFGGCTLNLIQTSAVEGVTSRVTKAYKDRFGLEAEVYPVRLVDGVGILPD